MKTIYVLIIGILVTLAVVMVNSLPTQENNTAQNNLTSTTSKPPTPAPLLWGAFAGNTPESLATLEEMVGKPVNMQAVFVGWGEVNGAFPSKFKSTVADQGKTLVIFWEPYGTTLDNIIAGVDDPYIEKWAAEAQAYGGPIILAPFHEMNGNWTPWDGTVGNNSAAKIIAAWKHLHRFFPADKNVKFGWVVNSESVPNTEANRLENYYPGDNYVDYVGVDGFNFGTPWENFDTIFDDALSRLQVYEKPIFIFSMASAENGQDMSGNPIPSGAKAAWITDAIAQIKTTPNLRGFIWFNENKEQNWLINSSATSLAAFQAALE